MKLTPAGHGECAPAVSLHPPFCGSGGGVVEPPTSFYQPVCDPRLLGLYVLVVKGYLF